MKIYIDLDGTILDVFERYCGILNLYLKENGKLISTEDYKSYRQSGYTDSRILKEKYGLNVESETLRNFKRQHLEKKEWLLKDVIIGNPEVLQKYKASFSIITQRHEKEIAKWQIQKLGLDKIFDEIIVLNPIDGKNSKLEYLRGKVGKQDSIIGDSLIELECARQLGMQGWFVQTGLFGEAIVKNEEIGKNYLDCVERIISKNEKDYAHCW